MHYLRQQHEAKEQAEFSQKDSETNPLKKLDWKVTDERILFEQAQHCLGAPLDWGPGANCPLSAALVVVTADHPSVLECIRFQGVEQSAFPKRLVPVWCLPPECP